MGHDRLRAWERAKPAGVVEVCLLKCRVKWAWS